MCGGIESCTTPLLKWLYLNKHVAGRQASSYTVKPETFFLLNWLVSSSYGSLVISYEKIHSLDEIIIIMSFLHLWVDVKFNIVLFL